MKASAELDAEWEEWGRRDPYFGVITHGDFRRAKLGDRERAAFFDSGVSYVGHVLGACRRHFGELPRFRRILDFGCGVGRIAIPLAAHGEELVGVDVSESMLEEARRNCDSFGAHNVTLVQAGDMTGQVGGKFDLVHSFIVFQHLEVERGREIFAGFLSALSEGGICIAHFTYAKAGYEETYGMPAAGVLDPFKQILRIPGRDPLMLMNPYNLNEIFYLAQKAGVANIQVEFTDHGGELGALLYFRR
jgi:SAM-dependent methyltransferase